MKTSSDFTIDATTFPASWTLELQGNECCSCVSVVSICARSVAFFFSLSLALFDPLNSVFLACRLETVCVLTPVQVVSSVFIVIIPFSDTIESLSCDTFLRFCVGLQCCDIFFLFYSVLCRISATVGTSTFISPARRLGEGFWSEWRWAVLSSVGCARVSWRVFFFFEGGLWLLILCLFRSRTSDEVPLPPSRLGKKQKNRTKEVQITSNNGAV